MLTKLNHQNSYGTGTETETDQWERVENLKINPHLINQSTHHSGGKDMQWRNDSVFSKCCWENWIHAKKNKIGSLSDTIDQNKLKMD